MTPIKTERLPGIIERFLRTKSLYANHLAHRCSLKQFTQKNCSAAGINPSASRNISRWRHQSHGRRIWIAANQGNSGFAHARVQNHFVEIDQRNHRKLRQAGFCGVCRAEPYLQDAGRINPNACLANECTVVIFSKQIGRKKFEQGLT